MNIKKANSIIQQISDTVSNWYEFAEKANVEKSYKEKISNSHLII
jgi:serine/threonine-protein kinase HipA